MRFDRKRFFDGFKANFDDTIDQEQVDGIEFLLAGFENNAAWAADIRHIAYALATIYHETAGSMQPVEEGYYLGRYGKKRVKQFQAGLRYFPYFGRGYVQLTWKANYAKAGKALGVDLVDDPGLALDKAVAFDVMTRGMFGGWFSAGQTLGKYIHGDKCDYKGARKIINGTDKAALIAGYAVQFEKILKVSAAVPAGEKPASLTEKADGERDTSSLAADEANSAARPPTFEPTEVEVKKETPSLFAKLGAGVTALTGIGINAGSLIQTKLEAMTPAQVLYLALALGLVGMAIYWYMRAAKAAQVRTLELVKTAADPASNTVTLTK